MKKLILLSIICVVLEAFGENQILTSNIYSRVSQVFKEDGGLASQSFFAEVYNGETYLWGSMQQPFLELVPVVSNNYAQIVEDWDAYATNGVVSFTIITAVGYSGSNVYTNFLDFMLTRYEQTHNTNDWGHVRHLRRMINTPVERYLTLNYDNVGVSNLILRIQSGAVQIGDHATKAVCNRLLSGEIRESYLLMKAAGAIE
jgi:hypothetical protein